METRNNEGNNEDNLCQVLREFEKDFKDLLTRLDPIVLRGLQDLAGPHLDIMVSDPRKNMEYLTHADPRLREVALEIGADYWQPGDLRSGVLEGIAISDPVVAVRDSAIRALGSCYARTRDRRVGHFLAAITRNDQLSDGIRLTSFMSLIRIHGISSLEGQGSLVPLSLGEIDWSLVALYHDAAG
jgi:hypothetical protein